MKRSSKEFQAVESNRSGDKYIISGRCLDEEIRVGDQFHLIYETTPLPLPLHLLDIIERSEPLNFQNVSGQVMAIRSYGKNLNALGPTMTGEMDIKGQDLDKIKPEHILGFE